MRRTSNRLQADTSDATTTRRMRGAAALALLPVALVLGACGGDGGAEGSGDGAPAEGGEGGGDLQPFRIGLPELKSDSVFQAMGVEQGFYEECGLDAELVPLSSGTTTVRGVLSNEVEMGVGGPSGVFSAVESGAPLVITGALLSLVPHLLYVNEEINSLEDLAGKQVGTGQPGALLQQLAYATFLEAGVDPKSVEYVNIGGSPDVFGAVVGGTVPAGVAGSEYTEQLEADPSIPVKVLVPMREALPNYVRNVEFFSQQFLEENREAAACALSAYIKGAQYAAENKDEAVQWAVEETGASEEAATKIWEEFTSNEGLVNLDYGVTPEQIELTQQVSVETGVLDEVIPYEEIVDPEIAEEAKALL